MRGRAESQAFRPSRSESRRKRILAAGAKPADRLRRRHSSRTTSYTAAAQLVGRDVGDTVARWVAGFNRDGLAAVVPRHGGGHRVRYGEAAQRRVLAEVARAPERARDGTATWSLTTLRDALRRADDGLPGISTYTIGRTLHAARYSWQKGRSWCETGVVVRKRKHAGLVTVVDPDAAAKRG